MTGRVRRYRDHRGGGRVENVGSARRNRAVPTVGAFPKEVGDASAIRLSPPLRLDGGIRDGDRSGARFRSGAEGEAAKCVDAFDDGIGRTDDPRRWKVRIDPPIGSEDGLDKLHDERLRRSGCEDGGAGSYVLCGKKLRQAGPRRIKTFCTCDCKKINHENGGKNEKT